MSGQVGLIDMVCGMHVGPVRHVEVTYMQGLWAKKHSGVCAGQGKSGQQAIWKAEREGQRPRLL